ncbi:hypothetical protein, partial [Acinetobacter variabilis]|uniref:hypothetical protein n=2 Tax=Acinetobacter TaxID=469 RepID=UPI0028A19071
MKKFKGYASLLLFFPLVACTVSTTSYNTWNKPGITRYEADNALAKCKYDLGLAKIDAMGKHPANTALPSDPISLNL